MSQVKSEMLYMEVINKDVEEIKGVESESTNNVEEVSESKYINRELSWLEFNKRILDLANRVDIPLYERLKFLAITESNLNEFKMVRMGYLKDKLTNLPYSKDISGMSPEEAYDKVKQELSDYMKCQSETYLNLRDLLGSKFTLLDRNSVFTEDEKVFIKDYFEDYIFGVLTPLVVDSGKSFPKIHVSSLNIIGVVRCKNSDNLLFNISIPSHLDRLIRISEDRYVLIEELIAMNFDKLFIGKRVKEFAVYKIYRNMYSESNVMSREGKLIDRMKENIKCKNNGEVLALEFTGTLRNRIRKELVKYLKSDFDTYKVLDTLDKTFLFELYGYLDSEHKYPEFTPALPGELLYETNVLKALDKGDILLHHPYQSFEPIVRMLDQASKDDSVVSIKQTLYRVSSKSPIIHALERAAYNGKQVTVFVEVKARFNESENIDWAERLEDAGCNVIYGIEDYKVHSKMTIITKKGKDGILKTYSHVGTGNYNEKTSEVYTDISILTSSKKIGRDLGKLFNILTGYSDSGVDLSKVYYAPRNLKSRIIKLIDREIEKSIKGEPSSIIIKCNSIENKEVIDKLYEAADIGVPIKAIIRGICCMKPRRNLTIKSIVGKYLEHSRIYSFGVGDTKEVLISSADLMSRNLDRRFETALEIPRDMIFKVDKILDICERDDVNSYIMNDDGTYAFKLMGPMIATTVYNSHVKFEKRAISNRVVKKYNKFK